MIPFMSKYKLSNSVSFGLGWDVSTGILTPSIFFDYIYKIHVLQTQLFIIVFYKQVHSMDTKYNGNGIIFTAASTLILRSVLRSFTFE